VAVYAVDYDLRKPGRNYDDLYKELKKFAVGGAILSSPSGSSSRIARRSQVHNQLKPRMDVNDGLVVHEARRSNAAWSGIQKDVSDWMEKYL
jgi:phage pi2 protein 07